MLVNTRIIRIEWGDCDPAGIIFYPRYLAFFDACTSALIERALGMTKARVPRSLRFRRPSARQHSSSDSTFPRDTATTSRSKRRSTHFRRSSFDVRHRLLKDGKLAVEGFETRVWVQSDPADRTKMKSAPLPHDVIARLSGGSEASG